MGEKISAGLSYVGVGWLIMAMVHYALGDYGRAAAAGILGIGFILARRL